MTLAERIAELITAHGTLREVARVVGIDVGYLSRLERGEKARPSDDILVKLGLRRVVSYERLRPLPAPPTREQTEQTEQTGAKDLTG